jgi:hypothetical protein
LGADAPMTEPLCPHCKSPVAAVNISDVQGLTNLQNKWNCIAYSCQACNCIISVQMDPVALRTDTLTEIARLLGK